MALQKNYNFKGLNIPNAYHRISYLRGYKKSGQFKMLLDVEVSAAQGEPCIEPRIGILECDYDINSPENALIQAYNALKTLDDYQDAETV